MVSDREERSSKRKEYRIDLRGVERRAAPARIPTPECDKIARCRPAAKAIGEFLEWLAESGRVLCETHDHEEGCRSPLTGFYACGRRRGEYVPVPVRTERLLAVYFGIDEEKAEKERRALLEALRGGGK